MRSRQPGLLGAPGLYSSVTVAGAAGMTCPFSYSRVRSLRTGGWRAVKAAGTQAVTPHDLRHTCASLAVSAGVNVLALQRMLGHQSAKVTLDTYADLFDDDLDAVSASLHARYSPENVGKMWAHGEHDGSQQTPKSLVTAQMQSERQCGRRDSNPHALSSTGT